METRICLSREELNALKYPVVVEMWNRRYCGKVKKDFNSEFSEGAERAMALRYYQLFRDWYVCVGTPAEHVFRPEALAFVKRLIKFFGGA